MKYFPKLEPEKRYVNSFKKYDNSLIELIVYSYIVKGISLLDIEEHLMGLHKTLGYECMHVLHYLGIKQKHKAIFMDFSIEDILLSLYECEHDVAIITLIFEKIKDNESKSNIDYISKAYKKKIKKHYKNNDSINSISDIELEAYYNAEMKIRNSSIQQKFRRELINEFNCKCAICSISDPGLLIASHILPYSRCDSNLNHLGNSQNGLLLCVLHDALFESGRYITFDGNGKIMIKESVNKEVYDDLKLNDNLKLSRKCLSENRKEYLKKHNMMFLFENSNK